jgi:Uma2 family endonuclease
MSSVVGEIVLPETKPETEWILDRPVQKMSPTRKHGILQFAFAKALEAWARANHPGQVSTEWRFRVSPPNEDIRPLIPDVAYMSFARLRPLSEKDRELPPVAPEIVVEILSPDDRQKDIDEKRRVYFAWGVSLEIIADPDAGIVEVYDGEHSFQLFDVSATKTLRIVGAGGLPGTLSLPLAEMFAEMDIPDE